MVRHWKLWLSGLLFLVLAGAVSAERSPIFLLGYLPCLGYHDGHSIAYWILELDSPNLNHKRRAVRELGTIGAEAAGAAEELGEIVLDETDRGLRVDASLSLIKIGYGARNAVSAMTRAMGDHDPVIRYNTAVALLRVGKASKPAVPILMAELLQERNDTNCLIFPATINEVIAVALGKARAGTPDAVPALIEFLNLADTPLKRAAVARALGEIGPDAQPALPQLEALLGDPNDQVRQAAREAVMNIVAR